MASPPASPIAVRSRWLTTLDRIGEPRRGALLLAAIALIVFGPALWHSVTLDARHFLLEDLRVKEFRFVELLTKGYWNPDPDDAAIVAGAGDLYRPVTLLWMSLFWQLSGPEQRALEQPFWLNAANVVLHALSVVLRFWLFVRLLGARSHAGAIAFLAALLLAVHPVATEAVATQVGAAEGLVLVAATLALLAWHRWQAEGSRRHAAWFAAALLIGLLAKENAIAIAALAPIGSWLLLRRTLRQSAIVAAVATVPVLLWVALRVAVTGAAAAVKDPVFAGYGPLATLQSALAAIGWYDVPALLWPFRLLAFVSHQALWPPDGFGDGRVLAGCAAIVAVVAATAVALRRDRAAAFGLLCFAIAFVPVSNLAVKIGALAATRFLYLPMTGLALAAAIGVERLARSRRPVLRIGGLAAAIALPAVWTIASLREVMVWRSDLHLQRVMAERMPDSMFCSGVAAALVPEIDTAMATKDKVLLARLRDEARQQLDRAIAAPRPSIPGIDAVPEDLLEILYKCYMSRSIAALVWDNDLDAAVRFCTAMRDLTRAGGAQSTILPGQSNWAPLEADAECMLAELAIQAAQRHPADGPQRAQQLVSAEAHIARARELAPDSMRPDEQYLRVLAVRGDTAALLREYEALYARARPRVARHSAAARLAIAWSAELERRGQTARALAVALETLVVGRDRFAEAAPYFDYGKQGIGSRDPAVRDLAVQALRVFLSRADARQAQAIAEARRLLGAQ